MLGEFAGVSGQRISQIINYGQQGEVLSNTLNKLKNPDEIDISTETRAILKLRMATGYNPFDREAPAFNHESNIAVPYIVSNGQKQITDPDFNRMTSQDWTTLIELGIVVDKDGTNGGYYLWGNPDTGDSTRSQSINGVQVEFTLAPNAGALINTALC